MAETALTENDVLRSRIYEVAVGVGENKYTVNQVCDTEFTFTSENKGFEGVSFLQHTSDGKTQLLALCEGNFCQGGKVGKTVGNGRVVIIEYHREDCEWKTIQTFKIPPEVNFKDYSGIDLEYNSENKNYKTVISSQENAEIWIGYFDVDNGFNDSQVGNKYHFPPSDSCHTI
eukprot:UN31831